MSVPLPAPKTRERRGRLAALSLVAPNHFTEQFRKYRDKSKACDHLPREQRPTFHQICALGSWLYKQAGYDNETYIQPLMAHADEKMKHYQRGHKLAWQAVNADLKL